MGVIRIIGSFVQNFDSFGEKIQINLKGKDTITTKLGGVCGLFVYVFMAVFFVFRT